MAGAREAKARAEAVNKRRIAAAAQVSDLNTEFEDLKLALEMDASEYQPSDLMEIKVPLDRAGEIMNNLFRDVQDISGFVMPERLNTDQQAFELVQPALRIENRAIEMRRYMHETRRKRDELDKPRQTAAGSVEQAQRLRLHVDAAAQEIRNLVEQMQQAGAENYPEIAAALLTAQRELLTGSQLVDGARQVILRKSYREAENLARRAQALFDSSLSKFDMIRLAGNDFAQAGPDAEKTLNEALRKLSEAKATLTARAALLSTDPNVYLQAAIQRIGEARRASKTKPPQYITCLRLAKEAILLIDDTVAQASTEVERLKTGRMTARDLLKEMQEAIQLARLTLNSQKSVPVKANKLYAEARNERDHLVEQGLQLDTLKPQELDRFNQELREATKKAREVTRLASS